MFTVVDYTFNIVIHEDFVFYMLSKVYASNNDLEEANIEFMILFSTNK